MRITLYLGNLLIGWESTAKKHPQQNPSLTTDAQTIPDEIPIEEQVREDGKIKIFYTQFVEDRVDTCMAFAKKLAKEMLSKFPEDEKIEWKIDLIPVVCS